MEENEIKDRFLNKMDDAYTDYEKCKILSELTIKEVDEIMAICGVTSRRTRGRGKRYDEKKLIRLWNEFHDTKILAEKLNISVSLVNSRLACAERKGLVIAERKGIKIDGRNHKRYKLSDSEISEIFYLFSQGKNYSQIARALKTTPCTVRSHILKEAAVNV